MAMVRMPFDELCRLLSDYVQVGYMEAVRAYEPAADMVRQGEVRAWLKMVHVDADTLPQAREARQDKASAAREGQELAALLLEKRDKAGRRRRRRHEGHGARRGAGQRRQTKNAGMRK